MPNRIKDATLDCDQCVSDMSSWQHLQRYRSETRTYTADVTGEARLPSLETLLLGKTQRSSSHHDHVPASGQEPEDTERDKNTYGDIVSLFHSGCSPRRGPPFLFEGKDGVDNGICDSYESLQV
jgi:hypothetical protein